MLLDSPTPESIARAAAGLPLGPGRLLVVLVAERDRPDLAAVVEELRRLDVEFCGGLFPGLIAGGCRVERGALLLTLPSEAAPVLVTGLDRPRPALSELAALRRDARTRTALVLVDGLTANVSRLLADVHGQLGDGVRFLGGGAGSLSLRQEPCVFTREGVFQDAAVIAFVSLESRLGVRHGWRRVSGPVVATRTRGNRIEELNWRTAFDVYRRAVEPYLDRELTPQNLFLASSAFPFGIHKEGAEDVVRDPVAVVEDGALLCVGEVPENAVLAVLRGERAWLVEAAGRAARDCLVGGAVRAESVLVFDCVSRTIFLGDGFDEELRAVREGLAPLVPDLEPCGALSLGEVASHESGTLEFLNKTIVVSVQHA